MPTDYTSLTIADIEREFTAIGQEAHDLFGPLDEAQLNWKPEANRWSVAQCLEHLLTIDRQMFTAMDAAVDPAKAKSLFTRVPLFPGFLGRMMIRSLGPDATRKFSAPKSTTPSASAIDAAIVGTFIFHQAESARHVREFGMHDPGRTLVRSPFAPVAYSLLDACRIMCAHERRHFEQARRVTEDTNFPVRSQSPG